MSVDSYPDIPKAVFKCKDENCTKPHYHLDPAIEPLEQLPPEKEIPMPDRPKVEIVPDAPVAESTPDETTP